MIKSGSFDIARVYLHQQQIQLNEIGSLQSCPVEEPTCNDNFMYSANKWVQIKLTFDYSQSKVKLHYQGNTKEDAFLCSTCNVNGITDIHIEPGNTNTYYDEFILTSHVAAPTVKAICSNYQYCDYNVDYRQKCTDLLLNVKYPHTVEPKGDIVETCMKRKEDGQYVDTQNVTSFMEDDMDELDWTTFCKFQTELNESIECGGLGMNDLEDYPTKCKPWIEPVDVLPVEIQYDLLACVSKSRRSMEKFTLSKTQ